MGRLQRRGNEHRGDKEGDAAHSAMRQACLWISA
jgi:hypothetical protein